MIQANEWMDREHACRNPILDLFGEERSACQNELNESERILSRVSNILFSGTDLILDKVFDRIGFNKIENVIFRKLVKARLSYPSSKAATVEYLKNYLMKTFG